MSEPQKFIAKTSSNDDNIISTVQYLHNEEFLINIVFFISSQLTIKNKPMDIPPLNSHKQEYPPMHNGEFNTSPIAIYTSEDNTISLDVKLENETVWLSQAQMSLLFDKDQSVVARHIANVFKEGELEEYSNMQILHITFSKFKPTKVYSLDVIISVGYRVKSKRGTQFRIWAISY